MTFKHSIFTFDSLLKSNFWLYDFDNEQPAFVKLKTVNKTVNELPKNRPYKTKKLLEDSLKLIT